MSLPVEFEPPSDAPGFEDDDIPFIDNDMLHPEVEFEAGMSALPVVGVFLIVACTVAFICQAAGDGLTDLNKVREMGAMDRSDVEKGEVWRLISATFLHGSFDHLFGNMVMLYILGIGCEHAFGRMQFLTLYITAGLFGSLLSMTDDRTSVGASGAIFGMAGGLVAMLWRDRARLHVRDRRIGFVIIAWALYQLGIGAIMAQVDNRAHIGGLLGGIAVGLILRPTVLEGTSEVNARGSTRAAFAIACIALIGTAIPFVPRLLKLA